MTIERLGTELVNRIAAGEVILRPANALKELIENSLDAGARRIAVKFSTDCLDLEVQDDGEGIEEAELPLALERFTTSKIISYEDIESLQSRGFRGEALASIAAVAQVEIVSRTPVALHGTYVKVEGGEVVKRERRSAPVGTQVRVKRLFYNTPARLKFLKSPATENANVMQVLLRQALSAPQVGFSVSQQGRELMELPAGQSLRDRFIQLLGEQLINNCLEVDYLAGSIRVKGYVGNPAVNRADRSQEFFFVNGRPISSLALARTLEGAYRGLLEARRFPVACLFMELPNNELDINVHPTKDEIRFRDERMVGGSVYKGVFEALLYSQSGLQVSLPSPPAPPGFPPAEQKKGEEAFGSSEQLSIPLRPAGGERQEPTTSPAGEKTASIEGLKEEEKPLPEGLTILGQLGACYILAEVEGNLLLIDQHAAHERILYHRVQQQREQKHLQPLLIPVKIELGVREAEAMQRLESLFGEMGIELEAFGERTYLVRTVPVGLEEVEWSNIVNDIINDYLEGGGKRALQDMRHQLMSRIACHSAVRAGQELSQEEMASLIGQLQGTPMSYTCPHGRPTSIIISQEQLARYFKRH